MKKIFYSCCLGILVLFSACKQTIIEPANNSGRVMFVNASAYLTEMLKTPNQNVLSYVLIDDGSPGVTIDSTNGAEGIASPVFRRVGGQPTIYFPFMQNALQSSQYSIGYMRLDAGKHRYDLLDTGKNSLIDTSYTLNTEKPMSVFFADSVLKFSSVAVEHDEKVVPGEARIKLVNLIPDAAGGGVSVQVAAQEPLTDGLAYLQSTSYVEYPVPEGERLYLNVYAKDNTATPFIQTSIAVRPGHSYLLMLKGYTKSLLRVRPEGGLLRIPAEPRLEIINTL